MGKDNLEGYECDGQLEMFDEEPKTLIEKLKDEIRLLKTDRAKNISHSTVYKLGYIAALSTVEGVISDLERRESEGGHNAYM